MKNKAIKALALFIATSFTMNLWSQGFKDITSEALKNPSFELSAEGVNYESTVVKSLKSLYGWEIPTPQEQSIANATSTEIGFTNNGKGGVNPSDGNFFFWCRKGWGNANGSLTTTTAELEAGTYYVEFDYKLADYTNNNNYNNLGSAMNVVVKSGETELVATTLAKRGYAIANNGSNPGSDTYMIDAPWTKMGAMFELTANGTATITVNQNLKNSGRSDVCYDNFKLYRVYFDTEEGATEFPLEVTGYIANPSFEAGSPSDNYSYHGWTVAKTGGEIDVRTSGTNVFGDNLDGIKIFNAWDNSSTNDKSISQVIAGLPVGKYKLTAYIGGYKGKKMSLFAGENSVTVAMEEGTSGESNAQFAELSFTKKSLDDLTIGIKSTEFYKADNFRLYYLGEDLSIYKEMCDNARNEAIAARDNSDYASITGLERTNLENVIDQTETVEEKKNAYLTAISSLETATNVFVSSKANYEALVTEKEIAAGLGMTDESIASATATTKTGLVALQDLKVAEYNYIQGTYTENATLGKWTEDFGGDLDGEGYKAGGPKYLDDWQGNKTTRTTKQTVTLPAGDYALSVIARGQAGASGNLYYKIGDVTTDIALIMKGNRGRGVDVNGVANFSDEGEYNYNGEGFGWEYRFITFHLDTETQVEIGASVTIQGQWASVYAPVLLTTEASVKALRMTEIANLLSTVPAGKMNATVQSTLNEKKGAAEAASVEGNTIDELETITTELNEAINAAKTSIAEYEKIATYIAKANTIDESIAADVDVQTQYDDGSLDKAEPVFQALEVATYNYVMTNFTYPVALSDNWNSAGTNTQAATFSNEHWSGEKREYKNQDDSNGQGWGASSWSIDFDQDVTLPAGEYVFKVAGRKSAGTTLELVVTMGETTLGTVSDFPNGNASLGITKTGEASFDPEAPAGFANNGAGFGWQWRYVKFELEEEATVKIAVHAETSEKYNWVSFGDYTLQMTEETYLEANKGGLDAPTAAAEALVDTKPMGTAENEDLKAALALPVTTGADLLAKIDALNAAVANANAWIPKYNEAKAPLVAALERFETYYNDAENGALDHMCKSRWTTAVDMAQAAAVAKDVTDSYEGFATATENLVAALDAATVSVGEYAALKTAIDEATPYLDGNDWGSDPFQKPESAKDEFNAIKTTAQKAYDDAEVDGEGVTAVIESLSTAVNDVVLNAPEGQRFYIKVATEGHANAGNAILATLGNTGNNNPTGYGLNTGNVTKGYLAQAFIFTQVEGNLYNISIERPEGTVYLTYGSLNGSAAGWKNQQIQATTDAEKKGEFKIVPTGQNGILKIFNTVDNNYIDCQAGGAIYTDTDISNEEFAFELASEHKVTLSISAAKWATLILPFDAELPEGVKAYSCAEADGETLTLNEATSIVANTPYLVSGAKGTYDFFGYGMAEKDSYTVDLFTGTYVEYQTTANSNTYVLQKHDNEVAFYLVGESAQPVVNPYRMYMTYEKAAGAPMFRIGRGATGIEDAEWTMDNGQWTIYDLMGRKVTTMEKGNMYIVNGKKVVIK